MNPQQNKPAEKPVAKAEEKKPPTAQPEAGKAPATKPEAKPAPVSPAPVPPTEAKKAQPETAKASATQPAEAKSTAPEATKPAPVVKPAETPKPVETKKPAEADKKAAPVAATQPATEQPADESGITPEEVLTAVASEFGGSGDVPSRLLMAFTLLKTARHYITDDWYVNLRSTKEFTEKFRFEMPDMKTWSASLERNTEYFMSNYLLISAIILVLSIIFSGFALTFSVLFPVLIGYSLQKLEKKEGAIVIAGTRITLSIQMAALVAIALPCCIEYGLLTAIHWTIVTTIMVVLAHSTFYTGKIKVVVRPATTATTPGAAQAKTSAVTPVATPAATPAVTKAAAPPAATTAAAPPATPAAPPAAPPASAGKKA